MTSATERTADVHEGLARPKVQVLTTPAATTIDYSTSRERPRGSVDATTPAAPLDPVSKLTRITATEIYMTENVPRFELDIVRTICYGISEFMQRDGGPEAIDKYIKSSMGPGAWKAFLQGEDRSPRPVLAAKDGIVDMKRVNGEWMVYLVTTKTIVVGCRDWATNEESYSPAHKNQDRIVPGQEYNGRSGFHVRRKTRGQSV